MKIGILRRSVQDLTSEEVAAYEAAFGDDAEYIVLDAWSSKAHAQLCLEHGIEVVILPEEPIPAQAMREGIPHVSVRDGRVKKLLPLVPEFEDFEG